MDLGRYLVERHLREHMPIAELAAVRGMHRSWLYKLLAGYRAEGDAGLQQRSAPQASRVPPSGDGQSRRRRSGTVRRSGHDGE
jgi:hypothetical protein